MQAICDARGRFLDVFVGCPGSVLYMMPGFCGTISSSTRAYTIRLAITSYPYLETPIGTLTPYKHPLQSQVQEKYNLHHFTYGMMKTHWWATLSKALEVHPNFKPDITACCDAYTIFALMWMMLRWRTSHLMKIPGIVLPATSGPESPGQHIRDGIAVYLSAPVQLPQQLNEHSYLWILFMCSVCIWVVHISHFKKWSNPDFVNFSNSQLKLHKLAL